MSEGQLSGGQLSGGQLSGGSIVGGSIVGGQLSGSIVAHPSQTPLENLGSSQLSTSSEVNKKFSYLLLILISVYLIHIAVYLIL